MQVRERHKIVALSGDVALEFCLARSLLVNSDFPVPRNVVDVLCVSFT